MFKSDTKYILLNNKIFQPRVFFFSVVNDLVISEDDTDISYEFYSYLGMYGESLKIEYLYVNKDFVCYYRIIDLLSIFNRNSLDIAGKVSRFSSSDILFENNIDINSHYLKNFKNAFLEKRINKLKCIK